ncbi:MAG TPA: type I glutamate--ammonia ligase [Anaerolineales bacterium]|nr:type I glutamate--ammonia ligase [Anaerolineales bacterium]
MAFSTPQDVINFIKAEGIKVIDVRFCDLFGQWQHFSVNAKAFDLGTFEDGLGFDGSSIRGFQFINDSDMLLLPDPTTAFRDPVLELPTLAIIADIYDPITKQPYQKDVRFVAKKAEAYLKQTGIGDTAFFGPEAEFFLFTDVRYEYTGRGASFYVDGPEAWWNSASNGKGGQLQPKRGYYPVPPADQYQDVRTQMMLALDAAGVIPEIHHHEVAVPGQCEFGIRFGAMLNMADRLMAYKYVIKNMARKMGLTATFMPKPMYGDNGSGMHCHQSIWKDGVNQMYSADGYAGLSDTAKYYIGGLLKHAPALLAFCAPTTNSYRRLVPGFEAPVNLAYSARNRSAICRIPMYALSPKAKRVEFRAPDPTATPYLAFAAMLMAGLDGIQNRIDPGEPQDKDLYELPAEEMALIPQVPGSLSEVLDALDADKDFLLQGDVFTEDLIDSYVGIKRAEADAVRLRPHPYEYVMYFDA